MTNNHEMFVEEKILSALKRLLSGRVNEILREYDFAIPEIEFGNYSAGNVVVPEMTLAFCERTEKERLIYLDAYSLTITFSLPETPESELCCYVYAAAVEKAFREDRTLGGAVDRIVFMGKKYAPPKKPHWGEGWEAAISFRLTVEEMKA